MKYKIAIKLLFPVLILTSLFTYSCSDDAGEYDKFINTYRDVLKVRVKYSDTLEANQKIAAILKRDGYTEKEFAAKFFELGSKRKDFIFTLDSLRNQISRDADSAKKTGSQNKIDSVKLKQKDIFLKLDSNRIPVQK